MAMLADMFERLSESFPELVEFRRNMHMYPELSFEEVDTPLKVAEFLKNCGLEVRTEVGGKGVVGHLQGGHPGPTVALRADFDALPIQDEKEVAYQSLVSGKMHACGHDVHTASLLGTAQVLSQFREHLHGSVVFIHQFAEEVMPGGALSMIEDGCLDGVDVIFGAHVWAGLPYGTIGARSGPTMAAADAFDIQINGQGGHGGQPHLCVDSLVIGTQLVGNLQHIVSRRVDPLSSAVVSVGSFHSGQSFNVIPDKAFMEGTVRTFDADIREYVAEQIEKVTASTCEQAGATYKLTYTKGYPALVNDEEQTHRVQRCAQALFSEKKFTYMEPIMAAEDFSYYLQKIPGCFFFVGGGNPAIGASYPHHHPKFDVDERAILTSGQMFLTLVMDVMQLSKLDEGHFPNIVKPEPVQKVI